MSRGVCSEVLILGTDDTCVDLDAAAIFAGWRQV